MTNQTKDIGSWTQDEVKEVTGTPMYFFKWENGLTECLSHSDVISRNIRFLTDH